MYIFLLNLNASLGLPNDLRKPLNASKSPTFAVSSVFPRPPVSYVQDVKKFSISALFLKCLSKLPLSSDNTSNSCLVVALDVIGSAPSNLSIVF